MDLPVFVVNDANAALAGEWAYGAARGCRDVGMLTLGTGIGSSVILDGVPLRGRHGSAGNLGGHFVANVGGAACTCGGLGCAEAEASGWALGADGARPPGVRSQRAGLGGHAGLPRGVSPRGGGRCRGGGAPRSERERVGGRGGVHDPRLRSRTG